MTYDPRKYGAKCGECPLAGCKVVPPRGNPNAAIALVADSPGYQDDKLGQQFVGSSEKTLKDLIPPEIRIADLWMTSLLLCRTEVPHLDGKRRFVMEEYLRYAKKSGLKSPIECCEPRFRAELAHLDANPNLGPNGLIVVPMGKFTLKKLIGHHKLAAWRGSPVAPLESSASTEDDILFKDEEV